MHGPDDDPERPATASSVRLLQPGLMLGGEPGTGPLDDARMPSATPSIRTRRATEEDIPALAEVCARAFARDPIYSFMTAQDARRHRRQVDGWLATLRFGSHHLSDTYTTSDLAGVAIWMPPDRAPRSLPDTLKSIPPFIRRSGWRRLPAVLFVRWYINLRLRPRPANHTYYLLAIAVDPGRQSGGIGAALMEPVLEECDRLRVHATLRTFAERSLPLYERHGFRIVADVRLPRTSLHGWALRRDPL